MSFLTGKWARELDYRLIKEVWGFRENRIAVRFAYEWRDDTGNWFRALRQRELGVRRSRTDARAHRDINDLPITTEERKFHWPLGRRPDDHPNLSELGL